MSELTTCNYCKLESIRRDAKKKNMKVVCMPSRYELGGEEVYVVKKGDKPNKKNWIAWIMGITDHCVC